MACTQTLLEAAKPYKFGSEGALYMYWDYQTKQLVAAYESTNYKAKPAFCPGRELYFAWQNAKGGIDRFVFRGKHEYTGEVSNTVYYRDIDNAERIADRGQAKHGYTVYSGKITRSESLLLRSLRESQCVWLLPEGISGNWISCYVVDGSYTDYVQGDMVNVSFQVLLSELIDTQRE